MRLLNEAGSASSFIRPEIMAIPQDQMNAQFLEEKGLSFTSIILNRILRFASTHFQIKKRSSLLASGEMGRAARDAFDMLDNADLKLGEIEGEDGEPHLFNTWQFSEPDAEL